MKTKTKILVLVSVLVLVSLACSLPMLKSNQQLPDGLIENYELPADAGLSSTYSFSPEQHAMLQDKGNPTRFIILFGGAARQETWFYDTTGYTIVFRDGVKVSEKEETPEYKEGMYATTYTPNLFYRDMVLDEIVLSTGKNRFMLTSVPELEDMRLMDLEGLTIGLVDGKISYVETIPALTETLLTPDDFIRLTAEELANEGVHPYLSLANFGGESIQEMFGEVEFRFEAKTMVMTFLGDQIEFDRLETNQYYEDADGGMTITFTADGLILNYFADGVQVTLIRTDGQTVSTASRTPEELGNEGTHSYITASTVSGEPIGEDWGSVEIRFLHEGLLYLQEGDILYFNQIEPNKYYSGMDGGHTITFTADGFNFFMESDNDGLILIRQD